MQLDLEQFIPYRLNRVSVAMSQRTRDVYCRRYRLTVPEWRTLASIGFFNRATAKQIAAHSTMHKSKVSRAVSALEGRRWIAREKNEDDRREDFLTLTRQGQKTYQELVPDVVAYERQILDRLGEREALQFLTSLARLEGVLGARRRIGAKG